MSRAPLAAQGLRAPRAATRGARALLVAIVALALPAAALASPREVIRDCALDGKLDKSYSQSDLAKAERGLPTDIDEYTDCRDVIRRAELGAAGRSGARRSGATPAAPGGPADPGGGTPGVDPLATASAAERKAFDETRKAVEATPVEVGGAVVKPAGDGFGGLQSANELPTPFLVVLILLALGALAATAWFLRTRVIRRPPAA